MISSLVAITQFQLLHISRDLLSCLTGISMEVSFQKEPLCIVVLSEHFVILFMLPI